MDLNDVRQQIDAARILRRAGVLSVTRLLPAARASARWGNTPAASIAAGAEIEPLATAIIDDDGLISYAELDGAVNAVANHLHQHGIRPGDGVGILCRNSRWFVIADAAAARVGARILYFNTGFAGPQFSEVLEREGAEAVVYDREFAGVVESGLGGRIGLVAHHEPSDPAGTLAEVVDSTARTPPARPEQFSRQVILTSGTTGTPKGADRAQLPRDLVTLATLFSRIPYQAGMRLHIAAPMFHAWGLANYVMAAGIGGSMVLTRRFDPERTLELVDRHRCAGLVAVPVMLQRILALPGEVRDGYDTSSLEMVPTSGSALPPSQATGWMDTFGDNLYNIYGSTEVAVATVATPEDMRAAPGTAGKPPIGVTVRLYDDDDQPITRPHVTGRIFVGNRIQFEGYTGGGSKAVIDGLMSVGDLGHFDDDGRLFVGGRDDDMIVSGGENVFPREVEDLLAAHDDVVEAAVIGVDDHEFGQRLKAFAVAAPGTTPDEAQLKAFVKASLANYKVPREIVFVDELPRNQTGKVLKRELRAL